MLRLTRSAVKLARPSPPAFVADAHVGFVGRDVHHADRVRPAPAGQLAAADDRHLLPFVQADAPAVESGRMPGSAAAASPPRLDALLP